MLSYLRLSFRTHARKTPFRNFTFDIIELETRVMPTVLMPSFVRYNPAGVNVPYDGSASPSGTTPATMRTTYGVNLAAFGTLVGTGAGQTIAIVEAYDQPNIASDLAAFDSHYGLAAPASFTQIDENGGTSLPSTDSPGGWGVETTLDVEWAHVIAPNASILLVEASSALDSDLYAAVDTARNYSGVSVVSMSWGGDESSGDSSNDSYFTTPSGHNGVTFVASSGDNGAYSANDSTTEIVGYPAASPDVIGVGGTTLTTGSGGSYSSESGWGDGSSSGIDGGSGGGISLYASRPSYQTGVVTQSTTKRTVPDVALDADPASGVPIYDTYDNTPSTPWAEYGGTSLAAPMWAGVIAIANQGRVHYGFTTLDGPTGTLPKLYALPASDFHDVTTGNNGYAAGAGYDLVTGRGTPIVNLVVRDLARGTPTVGSFTINPPSVGLGGAATLTASNVTESGGAITGVNFYRETNGTSGLQPATDTLLAAGIQSGTNWIALSTYQLPAGQYTYYAVATDSIGAKSIAASAGVTVTTTSGFSNWSGIELGISQVPITAGPLSSVSVVDSGTTVYTGPLNVANTLNRIRANDGTLESDDGSVYANNTDPMLPTDEGAYYVFVVDPSTGTDHDFSSQIAFPGPMRIIVSADGHVYFTGDDFASFTPVLAPSAGTPTIGSFAVSPTSVFIGGSVTLTASNVVEAGGTGAIMGVNFYRESNGTTGLQIASDTLVGAGTQNGTTWTLANVSTTGLVAGSYTYYAVAADVNAGNGAVVSASLTITPPGPILAWNVTGQSGFGAQGLGATTVGGGITNSLGLTRGSGVTTAGSAANNAWGGKNWASTFGAGISGNQFASFGLTVAAGDVLSLSAIDLNYRRGSAGPSSGYWQYQLNSGAWNLISNFTNEFSTSSFSGGSITEISLSGVSGLQNISAGTIVNIRVVPYGATTANGSWYVYDKSGNDLSINGTVAPALTSTATTITSHTPNPAIPTQAVAFSITVSGGVPDGQTVTLEDASNSNAIVGTGTLASGAAAITVSAGTLSAGTHSLFAVYGGDGSFAGSQSSQVTQAVLAPTTTTLTGNGPNPSSSGDGVSFTATVSGGSSISGETIVIEDASNADAVVASPTLSGGTVDFTISNLSVGTHELFVVYNGDSTHASSNSSPTPVTQMVNSAGPAPAVASVLVNGGEAAYLDANGLSVSLAEQNSVVEQILVTFNEAVTLDAGAFTITNNAAAVTVNLGPSPNTGAVIANFAVVPTSGNTQFIVTFSGAGTTAISGGTGSVINDGLYILNTIGSKVHANGQTAAADNNTGFWALYGSAASDNLVTTGSVGDGNSEVSVDNTDFSLFKNTFGSESDISTGPPLYIAALDANLDGYIDNLDYSKLKNNFGADWSF